MMARALENNGATVYICSRRRDVLEKAAHEHNVSPFDFTSIIEHSRRTRNAEVREPNTSRMRHQQPGIGTELGEYGQIAAWLSQSPCQ